MLNMFDPANAMTPNKALHVDYEGCEEFEGRIQKMFSTLIKLAWHTQLQVHKKNPARRELSSEE